MEERIKELEDRFDKKLEEMERRFKEELEARIGKVYREIVGIEEEEWKKGRGIE